CPGAANLRTPTLNVKKCPRCGGEVELFSNDVSVKCTKCGFEVYNDIASVSPVVQTRTRMRRSRDV
ncbi:MAG: hypothetical protein NTW33_07245, partial [Methanoregula sp.]|nr:hypothetical protein [Methanoregula sp.]